MSENKQIEHQGIVEQSDGERATVRILSQSACASCHAKGVCTAADLQEKLIDASCDRPFKHGDRVTLVGESRLGLQAAWWAYILPLFLILATLITTFTLTNNENLAGLLALGIMVPYFLILRLFNHKFFKTFSFTIKPSTE
ncbi:SoxR reducing system RseC family protein [Marinilabilia salmonicolor]|uniref:SoxR reducing system RseC family protein n=1 Tax=Marinilabilia salmonicolor TaxID=989 RepID=UPI00029AA685|nr:SoxR reducing system RseC family protein [Marinilabilia salmonicolor]